MSMFKRGGTIAMLSLLVCTAYAQSPEDFVTPEFKRSNGLELIRAQYAYAAGYTGKGIVIAIVDSGLDINHSEFAGRVSPYMRNYMPGFSAGDVYSGLDSGSNFHGTHVAGLAAAARDGKEMHGVAYNATVLPLRTSFADGELRRAFDRAIRAGAKVLNGSYGPPTLWDVDPAVPVPYRGQLEFQPLFSAVDEEYLMLQRLADADVAMIFSAGNERMDHPGAYTAIPTGNGMLPLITPENTDPLTGKPLYRFLDELPDNGPALFLGEIGSDPEGWAEVKEFDFSSLKGSLIAAVATGPQGLIAKYSNWCGAAKAWCMAAPGGDSFGPGGVADAMWSTAPYESYRYANGTSMAAPMIAGAAAVMREAFPYMTARQVIEIMLTSADRTSMPEWADSDIYGRGMMDLGTSINGPVVFNDMTFGAMFDPIFSVNTQGYDSVWRNNIRGTGGMSKAGAGTLTLTGQNSYTGNTTIVGGKLVVNGSIASSAHLHIGHGAVLGGSGVVGNTEVYGAVTPGNSVGTLTVKGNYTQHAGSVFELELGANGDSDVLKVTGHADIQAGSELEVIGLRASHLGRAFSFIEADSWSGNTFAGDNLHRAFIDLSPVVTGAAMTLGVHRNATSFASVATSPNQRALAAAADSQGVGGSVYDELVVLRTTSGVPALYDALAGEIYASTASALLDIDDSLRRTAFPRVRLGAGTYGQNGNGTDLQLSAGDHAMWGQALGSWGQLGGSAHTYALNRSTQGLLFGVDTLLTDTVKAGVAVGYTNSKFKGRSEDSAKADGYHALAYGNAQSGPWSLRGGVGYSWYSVNTRRSLNYADWGTASSRAHAQSTQVFAELAYAQPIAQITLEPYAGLAYTHLHQQGFTEKNSPAGLQASGSSSQVGYSTLGVRALWDMQTTTSGALQAVAGMGWRHALSGGKPSRELRLATGDAYRVSGTPLAQDALVAEVGVAWSNTARSSFSLNYAGQMAGSTRDHGVQVRAGWVF
ncbi:autotransporter domain-containing protein [Pusillimonas sp. ANT_WB101]|uniref:autotransporter domain-containing protein n=1 Tax=Pusillimonas sp. ANT_WB101 TaxID=2597356 RepID=UPI0011EE307D|nr:autotransporter serine protease [Pusillimonas sp. ANT_WB101]KAA0911554.1 autotransporter domain-containing protein [Pusillimonas sp. ANT_WB101]